MKKIWLSILQCKVDLLQSGYLKIFKNTDHFQYLPKIPWEPDKQTKHDNDNLKSAS